MSNKYSIRFYKDQEVRAIWNGANFQFLKRCAHEDWEKYFSYTIEDNILKVTFKPSITAIDVKTTKKDPGWGVKFDSISFKGL
jgi:hypothetical protein